MSGGRVILITAAGPGGEVDIGVRSEATPAELVMVLGGVLGVRLSGAIAEHRAPPRPGLPLGTKVALDVDVPFAASGVADGDMVFFRNPASQGTGSNELSD